MTGIARQLAISETQLINKGIENMRIMCVEVGVMEETLYRWWCLCISDDMTKDTRCQCAFWPYLAVSRGSHGSKPPASRSSNRTTGCTAITIKMVWCGAFVGSDIWQLAVAHMAQSRQPAGQVTEPPDVQPSPLKWCGVAHLSARCGRLMAFSRAMATLKPRKEVGNFAAEI